MRLYILLGRDVSRGRLVAFRELNVIDQDTIRFASGIELTVRSRDAVQRLSLLCGIDSFDKTRLIPVNGYELHRAVRIDEHEVHSPNGRGHFIQQFPPHFETVLHILLKLYPAPEDVGTGRVSGGDDLLHGPVVHALVAAVGIAAREYDVRFSLRIVVPVGNIHFGDIVAGPELKIRNLVFGFVGCRIIGVFGCFVPIRALEIARCTGFDTAHDVTTFALRPDVTHIVRCSRCYDEYTTFGISRVLRPRRLLQGLYRIAVGDRRPFIGSVLFFYPPPRFARIGVRRLVARYGEVNLRVFRRSDFGIIGFADDKSYVGIVASDGIALAPYVTCYNRSG